MKRLSRLVASTSTAAVLLAAASIPAQAAPVTPSTPRGGSLVAVGPIAEHGFPAWYRDSNGLRLEACVTLDDPLCSTLPDEVPNPEAPVVYPTNFPGEFFYQLAGAELTLADGTDVTVGLDLEGAWAAEEVREGDQMVFGRVRIRFDAPEGEKYRIIHPYGIDEIVADDRGVNMTEDIGTIPGAFGGAMNSRIGPFLRWDPAMAPAAPAGYVGDPGVEHRVVGSPYNTNFVRVERVAANGAVTVLGSTDLFSVQGRMAVNSGVNIDAATYTASSSGGVVEIYASSDAGKSIQVQGDATLGFATTPLRGQNGRYYGRFPVTGDPTGKSITVVNASDNPVASKSKALSDIVQVTEASYDADAMTLTVAATTSDRDSSVPTLTATGFGVLSGRTVFTDVLAPPHSVTVTSSAGGTATAALGTSGATFTPPAPIAAAVASGPALNNMSITLDGTGSTGTIASYAWQQTAGPAVTLTGAQTALASFTAPAVDTVLSFKLTVTGPGGTGETTVTVPVTGAQVLTASAGNDVTVRRGAKLTLDGTASKGAESYTWTQVGGAAAVATGLNTAKPTVTFPLLAGPIAPSHPGYTVSNAPLTFRLTVRSALGTSVDDVVVRPQVDVLNITAAEYRAGTEWRVSGTTSIPAGQKVTVVVGGLSGRVLGSAVVDALGAFTFRGAATITPPARTTTVSAVSALGGSQTGFTFRNR